MFANMQDELQSPNLHPKIAKWHSIGLLVCEIKGFLSQVCLPQGVNFNNILRAHLTYKSVLCRFSIITVRLCNFLLKEYQQKKLFVKCL